MKKLIKQTFFLMAMAIAIAGCKNSAEEIIEEPEEIYEEEEIEDIENLYEQPLSVIQKSVQGKWKVIAIYFRGFLYESYPKNTFVDISENRVELTIGANDFLVGHHLKSFSYIWENMEVFPFGSATPESYSTYVMQNNDYVTEGWYFDKIVNDTLSVNVNYPFNSYLFEGYYFLKIREKK